MEYDEWFEKIRKLGANADGEYRDIAVVVVDALIEVFDPSDKQMDQFTHAIGKRFYKNSS